MGREVPEEMALQLGVEASPEAWRLDGPGADGVDADAAAPHVNDQLRTRSAAPASTHCRR